MTALLDPWFKMDVGEGAFYALFGLVFVIVGIALLVLILMFIGFVMKKLNARKAETPSVSAALPPQERADDDGVSPEIVAAITAALMCYYQRENTKCDFVVRRIKRL